MKENYFLINGTTYIISYKDFKLDIYKIVDNNRVELTDTEKEYMDNIISKNSSYIYASQKLNEVLANNESINSNTMAPNLLEWLESVIPVEARDNFYKNIETLKIEEKEEFEGNIAAEYNAKDNVVSILPHDKHTSDIEYNKVLLHELLHMASSYYLKDENKILSGFDEINLDSEEPKNKYNHNRGITEGMTEILAYNGVKKANELESGYCVEGLLVNQVSQLVNPYVIIDAYFNNKGTEKMESSLRTIGFDSDKAYGLFRNIEINHCFSHEASEQNVLGKIQNSLLDYFEKKVKDGVMNDSIQINQLPMVFQAYENALVTPEKIKAMKKDPDMFVGLKESVDRFKELKGKYTGLVNMAGEETPVEEEKDNIVPFRRAGFSAVLLLGLITGLLSIGMIILGVYLGM